MQFVILKTDAPSLKAIVVCSDIALYQIGASGEPTQGAGAIAASRWRKIQRLLK